MKYRVIHFDMKSMIPAAEYALALAGEIAELGYTHILMEFEDKFPFEAFPAVAHPAAWSKEDFRRFNGKCRSLGLSVIPLLQCAGHLDYFLKHDEYKDLRKGTTYRWCLADGRAFDCWRTMAEEILEVFSDCTFFHIEADEVQLKRPCPKCGEIDRFAQYLEHVERCTDFVISRGRKVLVWDDVFRHHELEPLKALLQKVTPCVWLYRDDVNENIVRKYAELNIPFWGASKIQYNERYRGMGPQKKVRRNVDLWAEMNDKYTISGHIGTIWGRDQCQSPICDTFLQSMYMIAYLGETLQNGRISDMSAFNRRFAENFFGLPELDISAVTESFMYEPEQVKKELEKWLDKAPKHGDILKTWHMFNEIDLFYSYIDSCFAANNAMLPQYRRRMDPNEQTDNWLDGVRITAERTNELQKAMDEVLPAYFPQIMLDEFKAQRFMAMLEQNARWGEEIAAAKANRKI